MSLKLKIVSMLLVLLTAVSCTSLKTRLDRAGINDIAEDVLKDFQTDSPQQLQQFLASYDINSPLAPLELKEIKTTPLNDWQLDGDLIQEKISFPSTLKKSNGENDTAYFYLYRQGKLQNSKVILWIPGFGVSDLAFWFIKEFFYNELQAGYTVLFYNIPYHLNRIEENQKMGEGLFSGSNIRNLKLIQHIQFEIDTAVKFLKAEGVASISGWGGSIGAAFLWLSSTRIHYDHLTLLIPIVDWNSVIFHPLMGEVLKKMEQAGLSEALLRSTYARINPINYTSLTPPQKIQILYAKHDQLTPESETLAFSRKWQISHVKGYDESHASILINDQLYQDNLLFLKQLDHQSQ